MVYSISFLNGQRADVDEEYTEREHLLTELREVYLSSQHKNKVSPLTKEQEKKDLEMAQSMRQASLETHAKTKSTSSSGKLISIGAYLAFDQLYKDTVMQKILGSHFASFFNNLTVKMHTSANRERYTHQF